MTAGADLGDVRRVRRHLHRRPEPGFCEIETAAFVIEHLGPLVDELRYGADVIDVDLIRGAPDAAQLDAAAQRAREHGVPAELVTALSEGRTGVVATIRGAAPGAVMALRVDMDALPILESDSAAHAPAAGGFRSMLDGVMHACGHDGHVAIGLAVAHALADRRFAGEVRIIFQPAEEGLRGAAAIRPEVTADVDLMIGLHLGIDQPVGTISASVESLLASEKVRVELAGVPSHAALAPERGRNVMLAAASATLALHTLPQHSGGTVRLNVGRMDVGSAPNVIAESGYLVFEMRASRTVVLEELAARAREVIAGTAHAYGVEAEWLTVGGAPSLECSPEAVDRLLAAAEGVPGVDTVLVAAPMPASEDVALLIERVQRQGGIGTLAIVGASSPAPHHTSSFDLDERSLEIATDWLLRVFRAGL